MMVCGCANPACMVNGCMIANDMRNKYSQGGSWLQPPAPMNQVITIEQIRQIIREELAAAKAQGENND